jgi:hypothetical protein
VSALFTAQRLHRQMPRRAMQPRHKNRARRQSSRFASKQAKRVLRDFFSQVVVLYDPTRRPIHCMDVAFDDLRKDAIAASVHKLPQ